MIIWAHTCHPTTMSESRLYYIDASGVEGPLSTPEQIERAAQKVQRVRNAGIEAYKNKRAGARPHCCAIIKVNSEKQLALYKRMMEVVGKVEFDQTRVNQAIQDGVVTKELELEEDLNAFTVYFMKNLWASDGNLIFGQYLNEGDVSEDFFTKFEVSPVGQIAVKHRTDVEAKKQWKALYNVSHAIPSSPVLVSSPPPVNSSSPPPVNSSSSSQAVNVPSPPPVPRAEINLDNPFAMLTMEVASTTHSGKPNYSLPVIQSSTTQQTLSCVSDKNLIKCRLSKSKTSFTLKHNVLGRVVYCYCKPSGEVCVCWTDSNGGYEIITVNSQTATQHHAGIVKFVTWFHLVGFLSNHSGTVYVHDLNTGLEEIIPFNAPNLHLLAISPDCTCVGDSYHNHEEKQIQSVGSGNDVKQVAVRDGCISPSFISADDTLYIPEQKVFYNNVQQVFGDEVNDLWWWQQQGSGDNCFVMNGGNAMLQCNGKTAKRVSTLRNARIAYRVKPGVFLDDQLEPIAWDTSASTNLAQQ